MDKKINDKEKRKKQSKELNEPPKLTVLEEVGNSVTHGVGALLAIAGMVLLLIKSDTGMKVMASCFYGISLFLMMLMSCLYHSFKSGSTVKRLWRRFDYASIYLLIGGTFAPHSLVFDSMWNYYDKYFRARKIYVGSFYTIFHYRMERSYVYTRLV